RSERVAVYLEEVRQGLLVLAMVLLDRREADVRPLVVVTVITQVRGVDRVLAHVAIPFPVEELVQGGGLGVVRGDREPSRKQRQAEQGPMTQIHGTSDAINLSASVAKRSGMVSTLSDT